jgi:predicted methyltransferase
MKLSNIDRFIINDLFKATEGLFVFTLYSRYKVSPKELFESINKLEAEGILINSDDRISLTKEGVNFAIKRQMNYTDAEKSDKIPDFSKGPKIEVDKFYIPLDFEQ